MILMQSNEVSFDSQHHFTEWIPGFDNLTYSELAQLAWYTYPRYSISSFFTVNNLTHYINYLLIYLLTRVVMSVCYKIFFGCINTITSNSLVR